MATEDNVNESCVINHDRRSTVAIVVNKQWIVTSFNWACPLFGIVLVCDNKRSSLCPLVGKVSRSVMVMTARMVNQFNRVAIAVFRKEGFFTVDCFIVGGVF